MRKYVLEFIVLIVACAVDFPNCKRFPLKYLKFSTKISLNAQTTNIENNHNQYDTSTPFLQSVLEAAESISTNKRFFFPGHSGGLHASNFNFNLNMDLPELDEIDSVHSPGGSLQQSLELAAKLFGSLRTWFLVNGSTSGILTAILTVVKLHSQHMKQPASESILILGRDSHKSAFDAIQLAGCTAALLPCPVDPKFGIALGTTLESIKYALDTHGNKVCGVILTRPTYQGVMCTSSTLRELVHFCHSRGVPLLVDEAHGSHLRFLELGQWQDAIECGADIVVQSTHKTLTSLSQTAMMHIGPSSFQYISPSMNKDITVDSDVDREQKRAIDLIQQYYSMFTSTSANALLLASLDVTRAQMAAHGREMMNVTTDAVNDIRKRVRDANSFIHLLDDSTAIKHLNLVVDPLRLTIRFSGHNAQAIDDTMCEEDGIYCELNLEECITYAAPPGSTVADLEPLASSLLSQIDRWSVDTCVDTDDDSLDDTLILFTELNTVLWSLGAETECSLVLPDSESGLDIRVPVCTSLEDCVGTISAETVCPYPPGIPVLIRGEKLTQPIINLLMRLRGELGAGRTIAGVSDQTLNTLLVYNTII